jgi:hypothetical protein
MGGMVAAPALGALAGGQGLVAGFAVSAVLLILPAPLYLLAKVPPGTVDDTDVDGLPAAPAEAIAPS